MTLGTVPVLGLEPVDVSLQKVLRAIVPIVEEETIFLEEAHGRVLAQPVYAVQQLPSQHLSAMDGYAISSTMVGGLARTQSEYSAKEKRFISLKVKGKSLAGQPYEAPTDARFALRIFTGAAVPVGYDTVIPQELVEELSPGVIGFDPARIQSGANVRQPGEDIAANEMALSAGRLIGARELALLAQVGAASVQVVRRLRVAVLSTGEEIRNPDQPLASGQIYDTNRFMLLQLVRQTGAHAIDLGIVGDEPDHLASRLQHAATISDMVITSGGVSVGEADHTRQTLARIGQVNFWRLAIKPGRPLAFGSIRPPGVAQVPFFGLPGNPVASYVTFMAIVRHALGRLAGEDTGQAPMLLRARLADHTRKPAGRTEYLRCQLTLSTDGGWQARIFPSQSAASLKTLVSADGLAVLPHEAAELQAGDWIDVIPLQGH
jgi:molybdopterin molybdotransferase